MPPEPTHHSWSTERFGPRTAKAVEDKLGKPAFCPSDSQRLERQQAEFVEVPDVRRQPEEEAVVMLEAVDLTAVTASQCSDLVEAGAVVAVRYERSDGTLLTVYDAEAPVNSETNLISPGRPDRAGGVGRIVPGCSTIGLSWSN